MRFRAVIFSILVVVIAQLFSPVIARAETAGEIVKTTATRVIDRLNLEREQLDAHPERIYTLINELVIPHFDFTNMSRLVLGSAWTGATDGQRAAFLEQFKTLLVRTYATALKEYSDNKIVYHPEETTSNPKLVIVKTVVLDAVNKSSIPIDYRMYSVNEQWKVVDVAVDGVSLVSTYRGSFASEIRKSDLDTLISKLVERNQKIGQAQAKAQDQIL
jgi:phospholipid transport system substrate-binding protein